MNPTHEKQAVARWHVERRNYDGLDSFVIADAAGMVIATLPAQWEADANLLAAAPDLLAALRDLVAAEDLTIETFTAVEIDRLEAALKQAKSAIERAEGRA